MDRTATDLEGMRAQCAVLSRQVKDQTWRLENYQVQRHTLHSELQKKMQTSLTAEERAHEMDEVLSIEEANIKRLEREVERSREKQVNVCVRVSLYVCGCGCWCEWVDGCRWVDECVCMCVRESVCLSAYVRMYMCVCVSMNRWFKYPNE